MPKRMPLSFKNTELEQRLQKFLEKKSELIGTSAYLKQLLYEQMLREEELKGQDK